MSALPREIDDSLRARRPISGEEGRAWWRAVRLVLLFAPIYGLCAGSFSVGDPGRAPLALYSAVKMPVLVLGTTMLCLPAFFVIHVVSGLRREFGGAIGRVLHAQAVVSILLASMGPLIVVLYTGTGSHRAAVLGNGLVFLTAMLGGAWAAWRVGGRRRVWTLALWVALYTVVGIQLAWMLRPFIGSPGSPVRFFRDGAFTNGYIVVFRAVFG